MRMIVPVCRDIEGIFFREKIEDHLSRTGIISNVSYNQNESQKDTKILIDWQVESGTIPIFMTDIANPYGIRACSSLKIEVEGVKDEIPLIRQLMNILNERPIIFPDGEIKTIRDEFERNRPTTVTIEEHDYWNALSNSIRSLERAIYELSKLNQFIHLWRSFNSLYSYIYIYKRKNTEKAPTKASQREMFNYFIGNNNADSGKKPKTSKKHPKIYEGLDGKGSKSKYSNLITPQECRELVELFLSKYDLRWLYELKIDTMSVTKEGWKELVEKEVVRPLEGETKETLKEKRVWIFEGVEWENFLSFRNGLAFWERFEKGKYPAALSEVVAFVYEVNRNNIFHGGEPFFVEEEIALFQASIEMLYHLLIISIPKIFQQSVGVIRRNAMNYQTGVLG